MMRSLYSGISGLRNHQTRMDVIGNNISNVNTAGYKTSRVIFQDIFSQNVSGGMGNQDAIGGKNPIQIGLGIRLSSVDVLHTRSAFGRTDKPTDLCINGDGFFMVASGTFIDDRIQTYTNFDDLYYTRAGNFDIDNEGYLVTSQGHYVLGYLYDITVTPGTPGDPDADPPTPATPPIVNVNNRDADGKIDKSLRSDGAAVDNAAKMDSLGRIRVRVPNPPGDDIQLLNISVGSNGDVSVLIDGREEVIATIATAMFSNPGGLDKAGNSYYTASNASGNAVVTEPLDPDTGAGEINAGGLEMSNVDLASEFTDMIVTQRGFQANSRIITVSDTMLEELVNLKR